MQQSGWRLPNQEHWRLDTLAIRTGLKEAPMRFLAHLALFVEVANTGTIGHAGAALGMPASPLSRRMTALEHELGSLMRFFPLHLAMLNWLIANECAT